MPLTLGFLFCFVSLPVSGQALPRWSPQDVLTYHNNNMRTGANTNEFLLTPLNVKSNLFGKLFSCAVDGAVYAEPLYVAGLEVPGKGTHNAVFVATQHGSVYAFDADNNQGPNASPLWQVSFINPAAGVTPLTPSDAGVCGNVPREDVIAATPAIDLDTGTIFVEALTREATGDAVKFVHRLHALDIRTGNEQAMSPAVIQGSVTNSTGEAIVFDNLRQQCRTGLLLQNGFVYFGYSAQCDEGNYHGWVMAYNERTLQQAGIYNDTPNGSAGGIWQGSAGISADASGNMFATSGNGAFATNYNSLNQYNLSDSFLKLTGRNGLTLVDYFTPHNQADLDRADLDVSAGSSMVLPDAAGSTEHPHLLVGCGKDGTVYLLDRDQLGQFNAGGDTQIVEELPNIVGTPWNFPVPACFNNMIYYQGSDDVMKAFQIADGVIIAKPVSKSTVKFGSPGGIPSVSASSSSNGIVWALQTDAWSAHGPAVLHAYDATNLARELYSSKLNPAQDRPGAAVKFTTPMVANGKVYVGTDYYLSVYGQGVFLALPVVSPSGGTFTDSVTVTLSDATPGTSLFYTLDGGAPTAHSIRYTGPFVLTNSAAVQVIATAPGAVNSGTALASFRVRMP